MPMSARRFVVWDGDGEMLGVFADFTTAHVWAHMRVAEPNTPRPVEVEDRRARVSRRVDLGTCELVVWTEFGSVVGCALPPATEATAAKVS